MINYRSTSNLSATVAAAIVRWRWLLCVGGLLLLTIALPASRRLQFDRSIGAMFAPDDPTYLDYHELQRCFGGNAVVILVYRDDALKTSEGLQRNQQLSDQVAAVQGVNGVLSPAVLNRAVQKLQPTSLFSSSPALFRPNDPVAEGFDALFAGYTHSADHRWAAVVAMLRPDHSRSTIDHLEQLKNDLPDSLQAAIVGEPVLVHKGFDLIERDGARLASLTVILLSIVVVISLADFRFFLLTAIVVGWSVTVTRATMVALSIDLSLVSTILTAIVTVIAVTAVLHLGVRYRIARNRGCGQQLATFRAFAVLIAPIFWTCATDAAGFAALYASRILPIRQFGLMIAIASIAVFMALLLFGPVTMLLPGLPIGQRIQGYQRIQRLQQTASRRLRRICVRVAHAAIGRPAICIIAIVGCLLLTVVGIGRSETETSFLNNFRPNSTVVRDYTQVESDFGGAGVWDVTLAAPPEMTANYLLRVRELESDLRAIDIDGARLTKVLSLADADAIAARAPLSSLLAPSSRLSAMYLVMPVFFDALLTRADSSDDRTLRIMLRSREQLPAREKTRLIAEVDQVVDKHVTSDPWLQALEVPATTNDRATGGTVTGYYVLMARLVSQIVGDQWRCFLASGIMVWALLAVAARSVRWATVSLLPNLLPIFVVLALLGLAGGKINMGVAMIAAVSIGLSIDGCVHFLARYGRYRRRVHAPRPSAATAAGNIGVPVLLATVALVVGFGVLSTSEFIPTATFGTLVAATLALGTLVNLAVLPTVVVWSEKASGVSEQRD